jgi:glycosyltransferase involved in cell wall biosynthesis
MTNPKIIVIIPTRERCDVLKHALASVVQESYKNLQIIVSDNCSDDETCEVVNGFNDPRILYVKTAQRVSMSENWEFALGFVDDGWVTYMGDDDGIPLGAIQKVANIIEETGALAIRSRFVSFAWPGVNGQPNSRLITPKTKGFEWRDSKKWLGQCIQGKEKYTELPMIYNGGFIHSTVLGDIKRRGDKYFASSSPDVYSAVAIASVVEKYLFVHEPLAISGTSVHSTGTSFNSMSKKRNAAPAIMFSSERNIAFHHEVPLCNDGAFPKSLHALTYESYLQSRDLRAGDIQVDRKSQLEIILALDSHQGDSIISWGKSFAKMHGIDFNVAYRNSKLVGPFLRLRKNAIKLRAALQSVVINGEDIPLENVYQASIAATTSINRPGVLKSITTVIRDYVFRV